MPGACTAEVPSSFTVAASVTVHHALAASRAERRLPTPSSATSPTTAAVVTFRARPNNTRERYAGTDGHTAVVFYWCALARRAGVGREELNMGWEPAIGSAVVVDPDSDHALTGRIVDDFGEFAGQAIEVNNTRIAEPARRWAVLTDAGLLRFVDTDHLGPSSTSQPDGA